MLKEIALGIGIVAGFAVVLGLVALGMLLWSYRRPQDFEGEGSMWP